MTDSMSEKARVRHTIILVDRQTDRQRHRQTEESEAWQVPCCAQIDWTTTE